MMATPQSIVHSHYGKNVFLILLSLFFLPLDTTIVIASYILKYFQHGHKQQKSQTNNNPPQRTVLVTGVGMTKSLVLARQFKQSGHKVIGADFGYLSPGRVSNALDAYYPLQKPAGGSGPYVQSLLSIVEKENVDLWVSCSGVASAVEDGEAKEVLEGRTNCRAIQFDVATTQTLHEKDSFIRHTEDVGLNVPETLTIESRKEVEEALERAPNGRKYILKPIGMDDSARGNMTLLSLSTAKETTQHLQRLNISKTNPWILQQFIRGEEFCTHSLVLEGKVRAFVACPSSELLMYYEALPTSSPLSQAMLRFTEEYAAKGGKGFTGHLSFDFLVEDPTAKDIILYPIECNPRAHTAIALFNNTPGMADVYLSPSSKTIVTPQEPKKYYWIGHDLVMLLILPFLDLVTNPSSFRAFFHNAAMFAIHLTTWTDGTFDLQDPLPWGWLYHVYWPLTFLKCLREGTRWSRINVSTLKMFEM